MKASTLVSSRHLQSDLSLPAVAQQSMHRSVAFFKYSDTAVKAMTETPQDRAAQAAELAESFVCREAGSRLLVPGLVMNMMEIGYLDISRPRKRRGAESVRQSYGQFYKDQISFADDWRGVQGCDGEGQRM